MLAPVAPTAYQVRLDPLPHLDVLRLRWLELQSRSHGSFFQSWGWIGPWLSLICPPPIARLLSVYHGKRVVGLGVVTVRRGFLGLGPRHLRLHEIGDPALDNLTIEYNGLLTEKGREREVLAAAVAHLAMHDKRWLTFYVPGIDIDQVPMDKLRELGVGIRMRRRATHYVDLAAVRESGSDYVSTVLSPKARASVRRTARKLVATYGELQLTVATDTRERQAFFTQMAGLHEAYWTGDDDEHGAFNDPRILRFHDQLIEESNEHEGAQLVRLTAGDRVVGYVYVLVWQGVVYFYQAGIDYPRFGHYGSPGLLLLSEVIQRAMDDGHTRFELMAGESEYKRTLGMAEGKMAWMSLDRLGWRSSLRDTLRRLQGKGE